MSTDAGTKALKIVKSPSGDHTIYFHTDARLSVDYVGNPNGSQGGEGTKKLLGAILDIHGVQAAYVDRYKVKVEKTMAVEWELLAPHVEHVIRTAVEAAGGDLE